MKINIPDSIDLKNSKPYVFALCIHPSEFSIFLFHPAFPEINFHHLIPNADNRDVFANFKEVFFENDFFTFPYQKIWIVNKNRFFTFVPSAVFDEKDSPRYFHFQVVENRDKILSDALLTPDITLLHTLSETVYEFIVRSLPTARFISYLSPIVRTHYKEALLDSEQRMVVVLDRLGFDIVCFSRGSFLFANHFDTLDVGNIMYYLLFSWKQWKFDQNRDTMYIQSFREMLPLVEVLEEALKNYILNIIVHAESHIPVDLKTLQLCE